MHKFCVTEFTSHVLSGEYEYFKSGAKHTPSFILDYILMSINLRNSKAYGYSIDTVIRGSMYSCILSPPQSQLSVPIESLIGNIDEGMRKLDDLTLAFALLFFSLSLFRCVDREIV